MGASSETPPRRAHQRLLWSLALIPSLSLVLFYSLALRARLVLGRWPSFSNPDPKEIAPFHHLVVFYSVFAAYLSVPALLIVAAIAWYRQPNMGWQAVLAFLLCVGVLLGSAYLYRLDAGGLTEWFAD